MSPKQHRGEVTVEQLLDAALRVYGESGEQGLTVSAVTAASGVSPGSLYHHFGSMDGLLTALLMRWLERLLDRMVTALEHSDSARDGVRALVEAYLAFIRDHRAAGLLLHSSRADELGMREARRIRDAQEARLSPLSAWVSGHVESGEVARLPVALLESLVLGPVIGVSRRWLTLGDVDLDAAAAVLPDRIWRSIAADPR
ncbi:MULTISPECIES: TetR/AcrR family transcriptional regulator [Streptomyces]|uniref:TetR/AcrR family transcriptional regulator n=1 Tax=Streptomyces edwardsiae TaxID=3075527 RepID=A0ABU2PQV4_9ACTN|nr:MULTISPECIES: TetR/AcrR family transcriptional regulator [unclassified Streptomyces]MDT0394539.1 TetR/AcrR family transcriptional regulator [Streptomyces sp. DSM 41636]